MIATLAYWWILWIFASLLIGFIAVLQQDLSKKFHTYYGLNIFLLILSAVVISFVILPLSVLF